ncbi:MAG: L,D-transpeptidase [Verrucomicrobia bacterium]|nr:L,D-transpeptidase [Verrucomicrobiota bacterium]
MIDSIFKFYARLSFAALFVALLFSSCATKDKNHRIVVSISDQTMLVYNRGRAIGAYPVSTSKFGLGDNPGSASTPLGAMEIVKKIGDGAPAGAVFKSRKPTGEIIPTNAPGRDPIVTRILWLKGLQPENRNAFSRFIYIHGTPEERKIGRPASYGCIRMKSRDIVVVYNTVGIGAKVDVVEGPLPDIDLAQAQQKQHQNTISN